MLSKKEHQILVLLAEGTTYEQIPSRVRISKACLHTHCHHIRQKTGIVSTKNQKECMDYLVSGRVRRRESGPTPRQMDVLRLVATGKSYGQIAETLGLTSAQTAQNHASQGCQRAGIVRDGHQRTTKIRDYLEGQPSGSDMDPMADPMF